MNNFMEKVKQVVEGSEHETTLHFGDEDYFLVVLHLVQKQFNNLLNYANETEWHG